MQPCGAGDRQAAAPHGASVSGAGAARKDAGLWSLMNYRDIPSPTPLPGRCHPERSRPARSAGRRSQGSRIASAPHQRSFAAPGAAGRRPRLRSGWQTRDDGDRYLYHG